MTKTELIMLASEYYPEGRVEQMMFEDAEDKDLIALFIAAEANDATKCSDDSTFQRQILATRLERAIARLREVMDGVLADDRCDADDEDSK